MKEPIWIEKREALDLHDRLLELYGGSSGILDENLLESAMASPQWKFKYSANVDIIELAASYTTGIVNNHPFVDGNKRTGFVVGTLFLEINGYKFTASEEDAAQAVLQLAAKTLDETGYTSFLRTNVTP